VSDDNVVARDQGVLEVSGRMTFQTVPALLAQAAPLLDRPEPTNLTVDLAKVARVDTAGAALLLEWLAQARARRRELKFVNWPEQVRHFIGVSGLNKAFGLA
jgi:phospholipid transport system transporter-binding protein